MIIIHVLNSLTIGGLEKVVVDICNNIDSKNNQIYIITLSDIDFKLKSELKKNIVVISLPFKNDSFISLLSFWIFGMPKMIKVFKKLKPDIIHSHLYFHYLLFLALSIKWSKIKVCHFRTIHTSGLFYNSKSFINRFRLFTEKIAFKIYPIYLISISKQIQQNNCLFFSKITNKIKLIPNGIDLKKFTKENYTERKSDFGFKETDIIITYVSRLDHGKNHTVLLNAIAEVVKKNPNLHLCLLGDGVLKGALVKQSEKLNIEEKVTFFGNVNNVANILAVTDIAVFPSQFEGFPISVIEKMAMELPVIVSDISVFKEIILHEVNGLMYSVDNFNDLAEAILTLVNDNKKRIRLANNAKKTVLKYDIKQVTKDTIIFYEEALSFGF